MSTNGQVVGNSVLVESHGDDDNTAPVGANLRVIEIVEEKPRGKATQKPHANRPKQGGGSPDPSRWEVDTPQPDIEGTLEDSAVATGTSHLQEPDSDGDISTSERMERLEEQRTQLWRTLKGELLIYLKEISSERRALYHILKKTVEDSMTFHVMVRRLTSDKALEIITSALAEAAEVLPSYSAQAKENRELWHNQQVVQLEARRLVVFNEVQSEGLTERFFQWLKAKPGTRSTAIINAVQKPAQVNLQFRLDKGLPQMKALTSLTGVTEELEDAWREFNSESQSLEERWNAERGDRSKDLVLKRLRSRTRDAYALSFEEARKSFPLHVLEFTIEAVEKAADETFSEAFVTPQSSTKTRKLKTKGQIDRAQQQADARKNRSNGGKKA